MRRVSDVVMNGSYDMVDRHWFGDLSLAVLLALPLAGLTMGQPAQTKSAGPSKHLAAAPPHSEARIGLLA